MQPFAALGAGQTWIDSGAGLIGAVDLQAWSGSVAGGIRMPLGDSNRYALRVEARGYWVDLPGDRVVGDEFVRALESDLTQIETTVGLTFRLFKPRATRRTASSSPRASG